MSLYAHDAYQRTHYAKRRAAGLCARCDHRTPRSVCLVCIRKQLLAQKLDRIALAHRRLCTICGSKPLAGRKRCADCAESQRIAKAESRARKVAA